MFWFFCDLINPKMDTFCFVRDQIILCLGLQEPTYTHFVAVLSNTPTNFASIAQYHHLMRVLDLIASVQSLIVRHVSFMCITLQALSYRDLLRLMHECQYSVGQVTAYRSHIQVF